MRPDPSIVGGWCVVVCGVVVEREVGMSRDDVDVGFQPESGIP
jgi:hypothetical protein